MVLRITVWISCELRKIDGLQFLSCRVPDGQDEDRLLIFDHAKNYAMDVRSVAKEQMPEFILLSRYRATIGEIFQSVYGPFKISKPFQGGNRVLRVDIRIN